MKKLSVIVPTYNQGPLLHKTLRTLTQELKKITPHFEIIVINDGSKDNTEAEINKLSGLPLLHDVKFYTYPMNAGKGFALTYGFSKSSGDPVVFIDGDLEIHPRFIKHHLELMDQHQADIVIGSKRHPQSRVFYSWKRRLYSRTFQLLVKIFFHLNVTDTQVGLKIFKRKVLEQAIPLLAIKRWAFDLELLVVAYHLGFRHIMEAPVELRHKFSSNIGPGAVKYFLIDTAAIFYRKYILRYYDREIHNSNQKLRTQPRKTTVKHKSLDLH